MNADVRMMARWYAKPNDLIGGWCIMPEDKTPGESQFGEVADFTNEATARHIAQLHNDWLASRTPTPQETPDGPQQENPPASQATG